MPIAYRHDPEIDAIALTVSGVLTWPERQIMVRVAEFLIQELNIRNVFLDCSGLSKDGDIQEALAFAKHIEQRIEIFQGLRIAVLPAPDFFYLPSIGVLAAQGAGIAVAECQDEAEARAFFAEQAEIAREKTGNAA